MGISEELIGWYTENKRDLPWRETKDPYIIWVSEIILQQTRVDQGLDYFIRFINKYQNVSILALASANDVMKSWQGLGYYTRARNMHATAKFIHHELNGKFPDTFEGLLNLKGVGEYTAAAIASFAYDIPVVVNDGNVSRVLSRLFGIKKYINTTAGKYEIKALAQKIMDYKKPGIFNQAIMEFGALKCTPRNPGCISCPFKLQCVANKTNTVEKYPLRQVKGKSRIRYFNYLVILQHQYLIFRQRSEKDIWQSLYEFPLIETSAQLDIKQLKKYSEWHDIFGDVVYQLINTTGPFKHQLTHQTIMANFYMIIIKDNQVKNKKNFQYMEYNQIKNLPVPRLIDRYINLPETINYFDKLL